MFLRKLVLESTKGANLVEYIVVTGVVALGAIVAFRGFGNSLFAKADAFGTNVATLTPTEGAGGGSCAGGICTPESGNCFVAGTMVLTPQGERPIEGIRVGDLVDARDPET